MKILMPVLHAFQALALPVLFLVWAPPLSADDLAPLVVQGSISGPGTSPTGANDYTVTNRDISNLPLGENTNITDVLTQMPGVAIEFNLAGVNHYPSADINSYLNFRDYLAILQLQGAIGTDATYQLPTHFIPSPKGLSQMMLGS
jgi:hypothetical protein